MSKELLMKKFNEKVEDVKKEARGVLTAIDAFLENSTGDRVPLSFEESAPRKDVLVFREKVQEILDMNITIDNVPILESASTSILIEFSEFDRIVDDLDNIKFDIKMVS